MKYFSRSYCLLAAAAIIFVSCGSDKGGAKEVSKDTSEKKFDPAGYQKHGDTYDPKVTATDTMYKNKDSVPRSKDK